ncbi:Chloroperoxidase [Cantharellus anzutake]|uniref:Chloroperoxidase n=1 Tax=Cantharellus anzutake TaxID=1750568 RepID=UPI0019058CB8|nr:Chloroperoxidase [Cantharellus anzutake]KAF8343774.1 Chloroperoxidase [Cantharellus anzutake]
MAPLFIENTMLLVRIPLMGIFKLVKTLFANWNAPIKVLQTIGLYTVDFGYFLGNTFSRKRDARELFKPGQPGYNGIWPEHVPPLPTDSRAPCPGLNAMANHGILPHNGRKITFPELEKALQETWNFSPTLCKSTSDSLRSLFGRDFIDLSDLTGHNIVEHDASMLRRDAHFQPDQTIPAKDLIRNLLTFATGPRSPEKPEGYLTTSDIARFLSLRIAQSKNDNPQFYLTATHKFFMWGNGSMLFQVLGGDVKTLKTILEDEKIPEGYAHFARTRNGLTMLDQHLRTFEIALAMKDVQLPRSS